VNPIIRLPSKTQMEMVVPNLVPTRFWSIALQGHLKLRLERSIVPQKSLKSPVRLLHLSDVHMDWNTQNWLNALLPYLHSWVDLYQVDALVFTGDAIAYGDGYLPALREWMQALPQHIPHFGVMGNHDYYEGSKGVKVREALESGNMQILMNESVHCVLNSDLDEERGSFYVHGLDDYIRGTPQVQAILQSTELNSEANHFLLVHNPAQLAEPHAWDRFDLAFAGHTHGGQFKCPKWMARRLTESPFVSNWYAIQEHCQLFVHHATGTASIAFPIKLGRRRPPVSVPRYGLMSEVVIHEIFPVST
jgi:predicted MPP superfamily phosphohydrolase